MMFHALAVAMLLLSGAARGAEPTVSTAFLTQPRTPLQTVGPLQEQAIDEGLAGAKLGLADNNSSGRFTGRRFGLVEHRLARSGDAANTVRALLAQGIHYVVADLDRELLIAAADAARGTPLLLFNSRATDDELRNESCRANVLHTVPSRSMLADGLAQYLVWKRWSRWFLVVGPSAGDAQLAEAYKRSAKRFGARIIEERRWTFKPGHGRTDTGHVTLQTEIPAFTRGPDHDVLLVVDETDQFGPWLQGRTDRPRPVAGTHGLAATGWSPVSEQWGATQLQDRFRKQAGRWMNAYDYAAWAAMRSVAEAVLRSGSSEPKAVRGYLRHPDFLLAGFKGRGLSYREWDGQLRQPVLIAGSALLVSVSPQPGFLHRTSELDTLGFDKDESRCRL